MLGTTHCGFITGTIEGNAVVIHFASVNDGVGASAGGTYDGTTVALTGFASDNALTLTGIISGQETTSFAVYDSIYTPSEFTIPTQNLSVVSQNPLRT